MKVTVQSLPIFTPRTALPTPDLKRLLLPQGELAQLHDSPEPIHYIAWVDLIPGTLRGNHRHLEKVEHFYLIAGEVELGLLHTDTGRRETFILKVGDLVVIPPGVAHAYRPLKPGNAIEFAPQRHNPADTLRHPVLDPAPGT